MEATNQVKQGVIIFYRDEGWGFLRDADSKEEYFYHRTGFVNDFIPSMDDKVHFIIGKGKKGLIATKIEKIP
jgi:cold shock CspA family protein